MKLNFAFGDGPATGAVQFLDSLHSRTEHKSSEKRSKINCCVVCVVSTCNCFLFLLQARFNANDTRLYHLLYVIACVWHAQNGVL